MRMKVEEFRVLLDNILEEIPEEYFVDLNGGVCLEEKAKIHVKSVGDELKIMGEYVRSSTLGRSIWIYYGSFMDIYGHCSREKIYQELKKTVLHELTHHLESLAGFRDLEVEDEVQLGLYLKSKE